IVTPGASNVATTNVEVPRLSAEACLDGFELHGVDWYEPGGRARVAEQLAGAPAARIGGLGIDVDDELVELRLSLDPSEQARLAALSVDAAAALEGAVREWVPGELDIEIQARVAAALERSGAFGACLIVGGDDRVERFRHPLAAGEPMHRLVMAVVVAERGGLHAATTRFACTEVLAEEVRHAFAAARSVERAVLAACVPGAAYGEALGALDRGYAAAGHPGA